MTKLPESVFAEKGLDKYFVHRTGHGLGLEVHEAPYIVPVGPRSFDQGWRLRSNREPTCKERLESELRTI